MNVLGSWTIVSSPDFDESYLRLDGEPYISLSQDADRIVGRYHVGVQSGDLHGRVQPDGSVLGSFEGNDEMDEVSGTATIELDGDRLIFTMMHHQGDDYTYEAVRER